MLKRQRANAAAARTLVAGMPPRGMKPTASIPHFARNSLQRAAEHRAASMGSRDVLRGSGRLLPRKDQKWWTLACNRTVGGGLKKIEQGRTMLTKTHNYENHAASVSHFFVQARTETALRRLFSRGHLLSSQELDRIGFGTSFQVALTSVKTLPILSSVTEK